MASNKKTQERKYYSDPLDKWLSVGEALSLHDHGVFVARSGGAINDLIDMIEGAELSADLLLSCVEYLDELSDKFGDSETIPSSLIEGILIAQFSVLNEIRSEHPRHPEMQARLESSFEKVVPLFERSHQAWRSEARKKSTYFEQLIKEHVRRNIRLDGEDLDELEIEEMEPYFCLLAAMFVRSMEIEDADERFHVLSRQLSIASAKSIASMLLD